MYLYANMKLTIKNQERSKSMKKWQEPVLFDLSVNLTEMHDHQKNCVRPKQSGVCNDRDCYYFEPKNQGVTPGNSGYCSYTSPAS